MYPDSEITAALNAAQEDFVLEIGSTRSFFTTTGSIDLETGNMDLPDDFLGNLSVTLVTAASGGSRIRVKVVMMGTLDDQNPYWREVAAVQWPTTLAMNIGPAGTVLYAYPQPSATITNGLFFSYTPRPTEMEDDADESEPMAMFPSLQRTLLPFGALRQLILFEGGGDDGQYAKFEGLWQNEIVKAHRLLNGMYRGALSMAP